MHFEVDTAIPNNENDQATIFCTDYGAQFGVTEETLPACITSIQHELERQVSRQKEEAQAQASRTVQEQEEKPPRATATVTYSSSAAAALASKFTNQDVFVSTFPLGTKNFEYKYILGVNAAVNAVTFCQTFWSELEGAFVEVIYVTKLQLFLGEVILIF